MHEIIKEIVNSGIQLGLLKLKGENVYVLPGFYKSNCINLFMMSNGTVEAEALNKERTQITSFDDLVKLNYKWWMQSKKLSPKWEEPHHSWKPHFKRLGLSYES